MEIMKLLPPFVFAYIGSSHFQSLRHYPSVESDPPSAGVAVLSAGVVDPFVE